MDLKNELKNITLCVLIGYIGQFLIGGLGVCKSLVILPVILSPALFISIAAIYRLFKDYNSCLKFNKIALSCCIIAYDYLLFAIIPLTALFCIVIESCLRKVKVYS